MARRLPAPERVPYVLTGELPAGLTVAPPVEVHRSARRRRTVSARREGEGYVVQVPAGLSTQDEQRFVDELVGRLLRRETRALARSDADLLRRARALSVAHLDGTAMPAGVRWVPEMSSRWASCTPATRSIRLSERLRGMPDWVVDYVLVHELAHLLVGGHGPRFWALVERYPRTERARGFLEGVAMASGLALATDLDDEADGSPGGDDESTEGDEVGQLALPGPAA